MKRKCRYEPLAAQPLVLVLCQVRFSPVRKMDQYIPAIQDVFRRNGFPIERAAKVHQVTFGASGSVPVQVSEQQRWDYRNRTETWSILVMEDSVVLQTTNYDRFEGFAEKLRLAVQTVLTESEHDQLGVIERVGLRYIDAVRPTGDRDFRYYIREGFHGVSDEVFQPGQHVRHIQSVGGTLVGGHSGKMVVRVSQNLQGVVLPPDLVADAPKALKGADPGTLVTLVDMDHYIEGSFASDADWIVARSFQMHDHIIETFHDHVVTREAIQEWK